jgi:hypothetical protein
MVFAFEETGEKPIPVIVKLSNEGTSSPFTARLLFGVLNLRDHAVNSLEDRVQADYLRDAFDEQYSPVLQALTAARQAASELVQLVRGHAERVGTGEIVRFDGEALHIDESIDGTVRGRLVSLLNQGVVALKGLQRPLRLLGLDIGCLFQKEAKFADGVATLRAAGLDEVATYLEQVRSRWSEEFINLRIGFEHEGQTLSKFRYGRLPTGQVVVVAPEVHGVPVTEYARLTVNRLAVFIEEMLTYAFQRMFRAPMVVIEIPPAQRDPANVQRFTLYPAFPNVEAWTLSYHETTDFA